MTKWRYLFFFLCPAFVIGLHPFLALNRPVAAKVMVIEGWVPDTALNYAVNLFKTDHYQWIVTNGGKINQDNGAFMAGSTYAEQAKKALIDKGIDENKIFAVRTIRSHESKTYSYAQSTISWLLKNKKATTAINVLTLDAHARKSYVLYKKAAAHQMDVGIISIPPVDYHPYYWFFSIYGIQFVFKNLIGYLYALAVSSL